jgi:hypothetical protein
VPVEEIILLTCSTLTNLSCTRRYKLRWPLIAISTTLLIGGIVATATLFTDSEPENWRDGHQIQRLIDIQSDEFGDPDDPKPTVTLIMVHVGGGNNEPTFT